MMPVPLKQKMSFPLFFFPDMSVPLNLVVDSSKGCFLFPF